MKKIVIFLSAFIIAQSCTNNYVPAIKKEIALDASKKLQNIDGFGVNIAPSQWRNGNLIPVIDKLILDLGATLFRFDCTGLANWLDPARRNPDGSYPENYLDSIYSSKVDHYDFNHSYLLRNAKYV